MAEIRDYVCQPEEEVKLEKEELQRLGLSLPDAHQHKETLALMAKALKKKGGSPFCELPFDHMVEAEAMGADVNYGDDKTGPRVKDYRCRSMEEVLQLPDIDFQRGRIREVLGACKLLKEAGENVLLEVSGPFTILNGLIDPKYVFKDMRKQPERAGAVFEKLCRNMLAFIRESKEAGADLLSYSDSSGGISILGPKVSRQVVEEFTVPFLRKVKKETGEMAVVLCPKTTFALIDVGLAKWQDVKVAEGGISYGEACLRLKGREYFAGQMCIKKAAQILPEGVMKGIVLE